MTRTANIFTTSITNFRHNEQRLSEAGFRWGGRSDILCNIHGKLDLYRDRDGNVTPLATIVRGIRIFVSDFGSKTMTPFFEGEEKAWKAVPDAKKFPSTCALNAVDYVLAAGKFVFENKCPASGAKRLERVTIGIDPASADGDHSAVCIRDENGLITEVFNTKHEPFKWPFKKEGKMKSYKLNARTCAESIDFYEISKTLSRQNPIAILQNGTERGFVLVHKQLLRQAYFKGSGDALPECAFKGGLPVHKMQYGDAWAFYLVHPSEIPEWLKWAKEARAGAWKEDKATYKVSFPTI